MEREPRPDTLADRITWHLRTVQDGASDTELEHTFKTYHAHVNQVCRALAERGLLVRRQTGPTIRNFLAHPEPHAEDGPKRLSSTLTTPSPSALPTGFDPSRPWYWEGNVQATVADFLRQRGWAVKRTANTTTHETGKDIVAELNGRIVWVTVKGFPEGTTKTSPSTMARHWSSHALFDVVLWREEDPTVTILIALPRMTTYRSLAQRTSWFQRASGCAFIWVDEQGIHVEEGANAVLLGR